MHSYVCSTYICMYVNMYVHMYVYVCMYVCTVYIHRSNSHLYCISLNRAVLKYVSNVALFCNNRFYYANLIEMRLQIVLCMQYVCMHAFIIIY